jgi:hypothetical protein
MTPFSEKAKDKYFCEEGLTRVIGLMRRKKFAFSRSRFGPLGASMRSHVGDDALPDHADGQPPWPRRMGPRLRASH